MIGIIGAMDVEVNGLKELMSDKESKTISRVEFTGGKLCGKNVVVAVSGVGKVNAAVCAQTMIMNYDLSCIINTGVAGSLTMELNVGDVGVAVNVVQHDMDTSALGDPLGYIDGINLVKMPADPALYSALRDAAKTLGINCRMGTIASGDQFVSTIRRKAQVANNFSAIACEMEGGAIAQVCCINRLPFGVVRAISDGATGKSEIEYPEFKQLAAEMSNKIVVELLKNI